MEKHDRVAALGAAAGFSERLIAPEREAALAAWRRNAVTERDRVAEGPWRRRADLAIAAFDAGFWAPSDADAARALAAEDAARGIE